MTTRPTDEEIERMIEWAEHLADPIRFANLPEGIEFPGDVTARMLRSWLAERQAARGGVTDEMVEIARAAAMKIQHNKEMWFPMTDRRLRASLESITQPITSISDALNFLEEWALSGNTLHGDDIQRLHATVERIAPIAQSDKVQDLSNLTDDQLRDFVAIGLRHAEVSNFEIDDLRPAFKRLNAILSTSPQPQQAVPDGWRDNGAQLLRKKYGMDAVSSLTAIDELQTMLTAPVYNGKKGG